jgi:hypothetical protein
MDTPYTLTKTRLVAGVWEGELTTARADDPPELAVTHLERPLGAVSLTGIEGRAGAWLVRIGVPPELLSDGVQTVVISEARSGTRLGDFTIVAGEVLDDDIWAEVSLLRAELDLLKKAFRRHCLETS